MAVTAAHRVEQVVDVAAAALLSGAVAFCADKGGMAPVVAGASAVSGFGLALALLRSIKPKRQFAFSDFMPCELEEFEVVVAPARRIVPEPLLLTDQSTAASPQVNVPHELLLTALDRLQAAPAFELPELVLGDAERVNPSAGTGELLLSAADQLPTSAPQEEAELLLDDILAQLGPDSRVVRLFDPSAMPTAGELKTRIDRHLDHSRSPSAPVDASAALHEALDELRRAIR